MTLPLYCGFCGKSQHEVPKLIAGPSTHICNECVDTCHDIVHGKPYTPPPPTRVPTEWMKQVADLQQAVTKLQFAMLGWRFSAPEEPTGEVVGFGPRGDDEQ